MLPGVAVPTTSINGRVTELVAIANDANHPVPVDIGQNITIDNVTVSNEVEIKNDAGNPVPVSGTVTPAIQLGGGVVTASTTRVTLATDGPGVANLASIAGLQIPAHDYIALSYTGTNLTGVVYKTGGSGGTTVATLTLAYSGSNLTSVTKS